MLALDRFIRQMIVLYRTDLYMRGTHRLCLQHFPIYRTRLQMCAANCTCYHIAADNPSLREQAITLQING
ncbi:hypothetical protein D3C77_398050 [compost metagenome]